MGLAWNKYGIITTPDTPWQNPHHHTTHELNDWLNQQCQHPNYNIHPGQQHRQNTKFPHQCMYQCNTHQQTLISDTSNDLWGNQPLINQDNTKFWLRAISWNVNTLSNAHHTISWQALMQATLNIEADIMCIQETNTNWTIPAIITSTSKIFNNSTYQANKVVVDQQRLNWPTLPAWRYANCSPRKMDCMSNWHRLRSIQTWAMVIHQNARTKSHQIHHCLWILSWPQTTPVGSQNSVWPTVPDFVIPGTTPTQTKKTAIHWQSHQASQLRQQHIEVLVCLDANSTQGSWTTHCWNRPHQCPCQQISTVPTSCHPPMWHTIHWHHTCLPLVCQCHHGSLHPPIWSPNHHARWSLHTWNQSRHTDSIQQQIPPPSRFTQVWGVQSNLSQWYNISVISWFKAGRNLPLLNGSPHLSNWMHSHPMNF